MNKENKQYFSQFENIGKESVNGPEVFLKVQ